MQNKYYITAKTQRRKGKIIIKKFPIFIFHLFFSVSLRLCGDKFFIFSASLR